MNAPAQVQRLCSKCRGRINISRRDFALDILQVYSPGLTAMELARLYNGYICRQNHPGESPQTIHARTRRSRSDQANDNSAMREVLEQLEQSTQGSSNEKRIVRIPGARLNLAEHWTTMTWRQRQQDSDWNGGKKEAGRRTYERFQRDLIVRTGVPFAMVVRYVLLAEPKGLREEVVIRRVRLAIQKMMRSGGLESFRTNMITLKLVSSKRGETPAEEESRLLPETPRSPVEWAMVKDAVFKKLVRRQLHQLNVKGLSERLPQGTFFDGVLWRWAGEDVSQLKLGAKFAPSLF